MFESLRVYFISTLTQENLPTILEVVPNATSTQLDIYARTSKEPLLEESKRAETQHHAIVLQRERAGESKNFDMVCQRACEVSSCFFFFISDGEQIRKKEEKERR